MWSFYFRIASIPCGLTKRYYLWNATTHPFLQLCRSHCHQINRSMRHWTKKCLLPGTIMVTGCKCTKLCHASLCCRESWAYMVAGVRGPTGDWTSFYVLHLHQTCQRLSTILVHSVTRVTREPAIPPSLALVALAGLIWKAHRNGRVLCHWRPHSEDRSSPPQPSKRAPSDHTWHMVLLMPAEDFYRHQRSRQGQISAPQTASPPTFNKCVFTASNRLITVFKGNPLYSRRSTVLSLRKKKHLIAWGLHCLGNAILECQCFTFPICT